MKNKYQRLSSKERKKARIDYKNSSEENEKRYKIYKRLFIYGIILIIYGLIMLVSDIIWAELLKTSVWSYISDVSITLIGAFLLRNHYIFINNAVNQFLIDKSKETKKKGK